MPIGAVSMVAIALVALTGVTNPGSAKAALADALSGFSNELIWLIGVSIMVSLSLNKTGLGARIGYYFISLFGKKTLGIAYSPAIAETVLAPVTPSNTARGGGSSTRLCALSLTVSVQKPMTAPAEKSAAIWRW